MGRPRRWPRRFEVKWSFECPAFLAAVLGEMTAAATAEEAVEQWAIRRGRLGRSCIPGVIRHSPIRLDHRPRRVGSPSRFVSWTGRSSVALAIRKETLSTLG